MVKQKIKLSSRLAALVLAVLMMASLFPTAAFADGPEDTPVPADQPGSQPVIVEPVETTTPDGANTQPAESPAPTTTSTTEPAPAPAETPAYATQAELDAAFEAVGMADELEAVTAAVEAYITVYNRLSPEDQAANAEALAGAQSYLETLRQAAAAEETGEEFTDPEIEPLYDYNINGDYTITFRGKIKGEYKNLALAFVPYGRKSVSLSYEWNSSRNGWELKYSADSGVRVQLYYSFVNNSDMSGISWSYTSPSTGNGSSERTSYSGGIPVSNISKLKVDIQYVDQATGKVVGTGTFQPTAYGSHTVTGTAPAGYEIVGDTQKTVTTTKDESTPNPLQFIVKAVTQEASYTVKWLDTDGNTLKAAEPRKGTVGETVSATPGDKSINGYRYLQDKSTESAKLAASGTVLTLRFVKQITVTWKDGYTNTPIKTVTVDKGITDAELKKLYPQDPTRDGYVFTEWKKQTDENDNITITAQWNALYTVTFDTDGGAPIPSVQSVEKGKTATKPTNPAKNGYTFDGWYKVNDNGAMEAAKYDFTTPVIANITLKAKWIADTPTANPKLTRIQKVLVKAETEAADVNITGVTFPDADGIIRIPGGKTSVTLLYKITVTGEAGAQYKVTDADATWVAGDGSQSGDVISGTIAAGKTEAVIYVTKTFNQTDIDSGKVSNEAMLEAGDNTTEPDDDDDKKGNSGETPVVKTYTVTVNFKKDDQAGTTLKDSVTSDPIENEGNYKVTLESTKTRSMADLINLPRSIFDEGEQAWYSLDEVLSAGALAALEGKINGANVTLDLIYSKDMQGPNDTPNGTPDKYEIKVTYQVAHGAWNDGTTAEQSVYLIKYAADGITMSENGEATLGSTIPDVGNKPAAGYKKAGTWSPTATAATTVKVPTTYLYTYTQISAAATPDGGKWTDNTTGDKTLPLNDKGEVTLPEAGEITPPDGKELVGWTTDPSDPNAEIIKPGDKDIPTDDVTYHPVWKDKTEKVTVTFDPNEGTLTGAATVTTDKGTALGSSMPDDPTREGYTFNGWVIEGAGTAFDDETVVNGDIRVVAQWTQNTPVTPSPSPSPNPTPNPNPNPTPNPGPVNPTPAPTAAPEAPAAEPAAVPVAPAPVVPAAPAAPAEEDLPEPVTPEAGPAATPAPTATPEPVLESLDDEQAPLAGPGNGAWALVNLILMVLTILASILLLLGFAGKKQKELRDENGNRVLNANGEQQYEWSKKRHGGVRLFSLVPALGALIAFILTENIRLPMVLVDRWTLLMALIALVQVAVCLFAKKQKDEHDGETPSGPAPARA